MNEMQIYERDVQVSIKAADMLTVLAFKYGEYAPDFPAFSSGWCGAQMTFFIPGK